MLIITIGDESQCVKSIERFRLTNFLNKQAILFHENTIVKYEVWQVAQSTDCDWSEIWIKVILVFYAL